jgi:hypothetical protein
MSFKEFIQNFKENNSARKERLRLALEERRINNLVEERSKSSNERELLRYMKENREKQIKNELDIVRKERQREISFDHNALNTPNITKGGDNLLKQKKIFTNNKNMFVGQKSCLQNNPKLLDNGKILK